jgi:mycothiol synthase
MKMALLFEEFLIENAPQKAGLFYRGFNGESDYPVMAEIINAANQADQEDFVSKAEDIAHNYKHLQRSDINKDMVFIELDGHPLGYGRCMWDHEAEDNMYTYSFFLHAKPEGREDEIALPVVEYFLQRLTDIAASHPVSAKKYFQAWGSNHQEWWQEILTGLGFKPVRYGYGMVRPCSLPVEITPLPEGIEVRPVEEAHMRKIFDASAEAFRDHWGYVEPTETDYLRWLEDPNRDPSIWKVAWAGDEVVGMVGNFIDKDSNETFNRKRGYTEDISVRRQWRRQGVARALLTRSIQMFIDMGMVETYLGVDTENPNGALQLYTSVGYQQERVGITYRKELQS